MNTLVNQTIDYSTWEVQSRWSSQWENSKYWLSGGKNI